MKQVKNNNPVAFKQAGGSGIIQPCPPLCRGRAVAHRVMGLLIPLTRWKGGGQRGERRGGVKTCMPQVPTGGRKSCPASHWPVIWNHKTLQSKRSLFILQMENQAQELSWPQTELYRTIPEHWAPGPWAVVRGKGGALAESSQVPHSDNMEDGWAVRPWSPESFALRLPSGCRGPMCKTRG